MAHDLTAIPESLAVEPAIVKALEMANRAAWTEEELDDLEKREMWIAEQRHILHKARAAEQKALEAEQKVFEAEQKALGAEQKGRAAGLAEGEVKGKIEGKAEGKAEGKVEMLLRQLRRRFHTVPSELETRIRKADDALLDEWSDRILDARNLADIFGPDLPH